MSMISMNSDAYLDDKYASRVGRQPKRRRECKMSNVREAKPKSAAGRPGGLLTDFADLVRTIKTLFDPYRPEQHYMRGPGPKWRAKYAPATVGDMPAAGVLVPVKAR